ncbi:CRE-ACDH-11 protein [Aphelenchoides avenae]|nr:CRE-ACDH-11 protein [Aphelenchus avenae]
MQKVSLEALPLCTHTPGPDYERVDQDLKRFGDRVVNELEELAREAEIFPPQLVQYDAWGNRVDKLILTPAWNKLKQIAAEEGIIAIGYDPNVDPVTRRVHQIAKLFLFSPSSGLVNCPLAMTDGAAKTITELKLDSQSNELAEAYRRLVSRDGSKAWTSGQWMTEKMGGSDVSGGTDTLATRINGNKFRLNGYKWFSSAIDSDMTFTLASVTDARFQGNKGLSLFYLRIRDPDTGKLNGIQMVRLKKKLGTRQLPTAELLLENVEAIKVSDEGRGVASISNMLNITRIHNAAHSSSSVRRILSLARDYSQKRKVFGRYQSEWPLHVSTLAKVEIEARACLALLLEAARLLGRQESGNATEQELLLLRLITPVVKLYTGKRCVPLISECMECFGGQGYMEDTGIPLILRDAQVTPIWEGTTNVCALDVLRVLSSKSGVVDAFHARISELLKGSNETNDELLSKCFTCLDSALNQFCVVIKQALEDNQRMQLDRAAREVSMSLARIYCSALLTDFASDPSATGTDKEVAHRFCCREKLNTLHPYVASPKRNESDRDIVYENSTKSKL